MKIIPYTTKFGAQAIFISNLAHWAPTYRQDYNTSWLSQDGQLNTKEQERLANVGPIFLKYNNRKKKYKFGYLDTILLLNVNESLVWKRTAHLVNASEYNKLKSVFASLELLKYITRTWPTYELQSALESFWGTNGGSKPISLFYFASPVANRTNGKTLSPNLIVLERNIISNNANEISKVRAVILHEIIHARYEQRFFSKKLMGFLSNYKFDTSFELDGHTYYLKNVLREAAVNALVPNGYIGEKYLNINTKKRYERLRKTPLAYPIWERLMIFVAETVDALTRQYINNNLKIDDNYLIHLYKAVTAFKTEKLNKK